MEVHPTEALNPRIEVTPRDMEAVEQRLEATEPLLTALERLENHLNFVSTLTPIAFEDPRPCGA
jgi:hypothetical protein